MALSNYKGVEPGSRMARRLAGQTVLPEGAYLLVEGQETPLRQAMREILSQRPPAIVTSTADLQQQMRAEFADDQAAIEQAITDQTALQTEARHAMRLEDERPEDELTESQALLAVARAFGQWPF